MLNQSFDSPDDLPPFQLTQLDETLLRQLESAIGKHFYNNCCLIMQALLSNCQWHFKNNPNGLTLVIFCPDFEIYWHILHAVPCLAKKLKRFDNKARIRFCPPDREPWEIGITEISAIEKLLAS